MVKSQKIYTTCIIYPVGFGLSWVNFPYPIPSMLRGMGPVNPTHPFEPDRSPKFCAVSAVSGRVQFFCPALVKSDFIFLPSRKLNPIISIYFWDLPKSCSVCWVALGCLWLRCLSVPLSLSLS